MVYLQLSIICWSQQLPVSAWLAPRSTKTLKKLLRQEETYNRAPEFNTDTISLYAESMKAKRLSELNRDYPLTLIDVPAYEGEDRGNGR